jgi:hypothetical protein
MKAWQLLQAGLPRQILPAALTVGRFNNQLFAAFLGSTSRLYIGVFGLAMAPSQFRHISSHLVSFLNRGVDFSVLRASFTSPCILQATAFA